MRELLQKIFQKAKTTPVLSVYQDLYYMCLETLKTDIDLGVEYLVKLSEELERVIPIVNDELIVELYSLHKRVLRASAPYHFDHHPMNKGYRS